MSYEVEGKLVVIYDTVQVSDTFKKREFVIETKGEYPQTPKFQAVQDKCDVLDNFKVGDDISISFNLRGNAWEADGGETKYFNNLDAWKITSLGSQSTPESPSTEEEDDDLPF